LEKKKIKNFLEELSKKFEVFDVRKNILPPKEYFFPPREEIFNFKKNDKVVSIPKPPKNFVIFGLNLEDLEAITQLDEIMKKPEQDFFYCQRRKTAILIGLAESSIKIPTGGDIILEKINSREYRALILTVRGEKIAKSKFFKRNKNPKIKNYPPKPSPMEKLKELLLNPEFLSDAISWSFENDSKVWEELGKICLGCGICTYVCPLCYCFFADDRVNIDGKSCSRLRQWDACTLPDFAKVSGGHDFHPTLKERYYNWFYHKFVRGYKEYGKSLCVACGRCKKYCPARIDIETWILKIIKDYEKSQLASPLLG